MRLPFPPPCGTRPDDDEGNAPRFGGLFGSHRRGPFAGKRGARMFDSGALRLVVLGLVAEAPRHGYDIIRHLKDRFQGSYSPSPGAIYPLLKSLTEVGFVTVNADGKKRLFTITGAGREWLAAQADELATINRQLDQAAGPIDTHNIGGAIAAFRAALFARIRGRDFSTAEAERITAILDRARRDIEQG
jgi:DNA-binding PadR family transcriptional regulator